MGKSKKPASLESLHTVGDPKGYLLCSAISRQLGDQKGCHGNVIKPLKEFKIFCIFYFQ